MEDVFKLAGKTFQSRLLMGTARFPDSRSLMKSIEVSGSEIVTVSMRRLNLVNSHIGAVLQQLHSTGLHVLPNTAGCHTAKEAVLTAKLAREALGTHWIKLEVIGDERTLYPDVHELLKATEELIGDGFIVLPYCNDDLVVCRKLAAMGCAAVMPLGSPIGSGMGILNPYNLAIMREQIEIPIILDAGIGTASDAAKAMEIGVDAVLVNTAIARAQNPVLMATSMKLACRAGRMSYLSGRIPRKQFAEASSPFEGVIFT